MQGISAKARLLSVDASLLRVNSPAPLLNESSSSANKTDKPFACPFCLMHYVRGIRTRALRKRHSASFLAADRRLLQSIKTADQGCFAKDKNESLFLRHKNPTYIVGFFVATEEEFLRNKIRGPQKILLYFWGKGAHKQKSEHYCLQ